MLFIARLFKSYCCSFYGAEAWRIDLPGYKRICISLNKSVRNIIKLPITTHTGIRTIRYTWIFGPLLGQLIFIGNYNNALYVFLCSMQNNNNTLVSACYKYASSNANSPLGYNIAYFSNSYGIDIFSNVCVKEVIRPPRLDNEQPMIISELKMLLLANAK